MPKPALGRQLGRATALPVLFRISDQKFSDLTTHDPISGSNGLRCFATSIGMSRFGLLRSGSLASVPAQCFLQVLPGHVPVPGPTNSQRINNG